MKIRKAFCLFEQSGTFKNEFIRLGIPAEDYDIRNDFGQTDHTTDLFAEIDKAYGGEASIFDCVGKEDLVFAFFPCTRFECQSQMMLSGNQFQAKKWSENQKIVYAMKTHSELSRLYELLCKLFAIANRGGVASHSRKPGNAAALFDSIFSYQAGADRQGPDKKRRLLQEAYTILVCELHARAKHVF